MPESGGTITPMLTYPASERATRLDLAYAGTPAVGVSVFVGGGTLIQRSGLPLYFPVSPAQTPELLRRP